jgi:RNA polymerase sigma-70 factor (ECF subfamily)
MMADPVATSTSHEGTVDTTTAARPSLLPLERRGLATDKEPFRQLFEEHAVAVGRTLRYLGVAEADLMDAAQEVFLVVNRRHGEFEGRSMLSTWIHEICVRVALSIRRRQRRRHEEVVPEPPDTGIDADQDARIEQREQRQMLTTLLDCLDETQREIIVLHEIERLPMREIAEIVGCPLQTAYSRRNAALEKMRSRLGRGRMRDEEV